MFTSILPFAFPQISLMIVFSSTSMKQKAEQLDTSFTITYESEAVHPFPSITSIMYVPELKFERS